MQEKSFPLLNADAQETLQDALLYTNMSELKDYCRILNLSESGKKMELIERIIFFIKTGKKSQPQTIPSSSLAKNFPTQALAPHALMLYGSYKNDAQTRAFFKQLIGPHFHFTAFGIDWLNKRWLKGNPPTYQEFADYWIQETNQRKAKSPSPKKEWAYINFLQQATTQNPSISKSDLIKAWKKLRLEKVQRADCIIKNLL